MAGLLGSIGDWLGADPSQPASPAAVSGGLLGAGSPTASTQTPTQPNAAFAMGPRWLQLLLGGLNGLSGSTGYTGLAALGHGAATSEQASMERLKQNAQMAMSGQEYQKGKQSLQAGKVDLAEKYGNLSRTAAMLRDMTGDQSITPEKLLQNPELASQIMGGQPASAQPTSAPQQAPATQPPATPASDTIPQPGYSTTPAGGALSPQGAAPVPQQAPVQPQAPEQQPAADTSTTYALSQPQPGDDAALAGFRSALKSAMYYAPAKIPEIEQKITEYQNAPAQAARTAAATQDATSYSQPGITKNLSDLGQQYNKEDSVQAMHQATPYYNEAMAADKAHRTAKNPDEQLASDMDLANTTIKMMNLNSGSLRPQTTEAIEEAKGYSAMAQKAIQTVMGGTGLSDEVRQTMLNVIKQHYAAYKKDYDTTVGNYQKRAKMYVRNGQTVDESSWRGDAPQAPAQVASDADYAALPSGTQFTGPDGKLRVKP